MIIRKAEEKDIPRILELLKQVLQIHADIRPDIFVPGTTKYTIDELTELLKNKEKPIYVAVDENDVCRGYAFCQLQMCIRDRYLCICSSPYSTSLLYPEHDRLRSQCLLWLHCQTC